MAEGINDSDKATEASGSAGRRMSEAEFAEARELYELGKVGLADLADKFGVSRQALSRRLKDAGAVRASRAHEVAAAASAAAKASTTASVERFTDKRAQWIEEARIEGVKSLKLVRQIAQKVFRDNAAAARPVAAMDDDMKTLARFNKILCDNFDKTLQILQADEHIDEEDLPTLSIEDLTNEEILQHHKNTGALPDDATIEDMLAEGADEVIEISDD